MLKTSEEKAARAAESKRPRRPTDDSAYREALAKRDDLRRQLEERKRAARESAGSRQDLETDLELEEGVAEALGDPERRDAIRKHRESETASKRDVRVLREALRRQEETVREAWTAARDAAARDFRKWHRPLARRLVKAYEELVAAAEAEDALFESAADVMPTGTESSAYVGADPCAFPDLDGIQFAHGLVEKRAKELGYQ